ncbi:MAG: hypothetical protein Q4F66_11705, partial [Clostridium sp.]|nr:hypothetical protein [Clostridium sp.]
MNKKTRIIIARSLVMTALISVGNEFAEGRAIPVSASEVNRSRDTYSDTESKKEYVQNKFFNAINNLEDKVSFDLYGAEGYELSQEDIREYYESFLFEHPEIFYVADTDFWQISRMENDSCEIYIGYIYDKDDIPSMKDKLEEKIAKILNNISSYDEVRKTYEIYDYIRLNNSYSEEYDEADIDYSGCETIDERLERIKGNKDFFEAHSVYGTLVNETSVWEGYSRALNMLLKKEEIESGVIRNGDYGWNYVNINGQYYRLRINYDEDYNKYLSNPYKYFNFSDRYNYLEDNGDVGLGFEFNDTTYDDIFRNSNDDETGSKNVVRIEDKLYHLDYEYKLYTYNLNGTNKKYIYNFNKSGSYNTTIRFMKSYKKYLYFVSYQFVNEKYICIIKRYNIETQKIEQVLNLNTALNIDIINETYINKINFYIKNEIIYIDYDERDESFELGDLNIKEEDSYDDPSDDPTDDGNDDSSDG